MVMREDKHTAAKKAVDGVDAGGWKPGMGQLLALALCLLLIIAAVVLGVTTGIGLLFAVPLIALVIVITLVLFRSQKAPRQLAGPCPFCGAPVTAAEHIAELDCPSCRRRIEIRDGGLVRPV